MCLHVFLNALFLFPVETPLPPTPTDPCEQVKCGVKESCVKGKCVHVSTATCHAVGDPHYLTFDGRRFDFQVTIITSYSSAGSYYLLLLYYYYYSVEVDRDKLDRDSYDLNGEYPHVWHDPSWKRCSRSSVP